MFDIAIMGAGPAGRTAAFDLLAKGLPEVYNKLLAPSKSKSNAVERITYLMHSKRYDGKR